MKNNMISSSLPLLLERLVSSPYLCDITNASIFMVGGDWKPKTWQSWPATQWTVLAQACVSWPIGRHWVFRRRGLKETGAQRVFQTEREHRAPVWDYSQTFCTCCAKNLHQNDKKEMDFTWLTYIRSREAVKKSYIFASWNEEYARWGAEVITVYRIKWRFCFWFTDEMWCIKPRLRSRMICISYSSCCVTIFHACISQNNVCFLIFILCI